MAQAVDLPPIVSFAISKGGAGKTSLTANFAGTLARSGWRVLAVCMDPQDNLGEELGYTHRGESDDGKALVEALLDGAPLRPSLTDVRPDLDVICAGPLLGAARRDLILRDVAPTALADALHPLAADYDAVVIDCPPLDETLQELALVASDWLITPSQADLSSRKGIRDLAGAFIAARHHNPDLQFGAVVLFDVPKSATRMTREVRDYLTTELDDLARVCEHSIRTAKVVATEARDRGLLVHELAALAEQAPPFWKIRRGEAKASGVPDAAVSVAQDYALVAAEILSIIQPEDD